MSNSPESGQPGPDETEPRDGEEGDETNAFGPGDPLGIALVETEFGRIYREQQVAEYEKFMQELREREAREAVEKALPDTPVETDTSNGDAEHGEGA